MINFKKEKLIKKHLGINTPDWIVQNCIKMLNEFEDVALTIHDVSNCADLKHELEVTDKLLNERQRVLDAIPECQSHGKCVPHAIEWIEEMKAKHCC